MVTQGSVLSRGTTTTWSMATSALIEGTTEPVELNCTSVELTRDNRDYRARIQLLLSDSPVGYGPVNDLEAEIQDAKDSIYHRALVGYDVSDGVEYARRLESELSVARQRIAAQKNARLREIHDEISQYFDSQFRIDPKAGDVDIFVSDINPDLIVEDDEDSEVVPPQFLHGSEEAGQFLSIMVNRGVQNLHLSTDYGDDAAIMTVVRELPLPVYGTKPESLQSLWDLLGSKLPSGATIAVTGYLGAHHGPGVVAVGLTGAFVVWCATPFVKTLREESHEVFVDWTRKKLRGGDDVR